MIKLQHIETSYCNRILISSTINETIPVISDYFDMNFDCLT